VGVPSSAPQKNFNKQLLLNNNLKNQQVLPDNGVLLSPALLSNCGVSVTSSSSSSRPALLSERIK